MRKKKTHLGRLRKLYLQLRAFRPYRSSYTLGIYINARIKCLYNCKYKHRRGREMTRAPKRSPQKIPLLPAGRPHIQFSRTRRRCRRADIGICSIAASNRGTLSRISHTYMLIYTFTRCLCVFLCDHHTHIYVHKPHITCVSDAALKCAHMDLI